MRPFVRETGPARIVFGAGTVTTVGEEVDRLGAAQALVLSTPEQSDLADRIAGLLGTRAAGTFTEAAMHTPVDVTDRALTVFKHLGADAVVSVGGGSTTGLGKAVASRLGVPHLVVPTTYAGSEVTPVLGETAKGEKTTRSAADILPDAVIYDVDLTLTLPWEMTVTSAVNALAHAVEALYAADGTPEVDAMAIEAIGSLTSGLRALAADRNDIEARGELLYGAWLAGTCLGAVGMGLHHKLCHTLGGSFDLPHSPTHTVVLPYAMGYNAPAVPEVMQRIARAMAVEANGGATEPSGTADMSSAAVAVQQLVRELDGPTSLGELGFQESDIERAVGLATARQYPNPREVTKEGMRDLLTRALHGTPIGGSPAVTQPARSFATSLSGPDSSGPDSSGPSAETLAAARALTTQVVSSFDDAPPRLRELLQALVSHLHALVLEHDVTDEEWRCAVEFLTRAGHITTDTRQEFILLSDTLGVSSLVDLLTNSRAPGATPSAVLGPFYVEGPPELRHGVDISGGDLDGDPVWVEVRVTDPVDRPVADAVVDVWQSNKDGFYDVQLPDLEGPVLRGRLRTDADGWVRFWTILPAPYPIPDDGPVGQMLEATRRHPMRAPHLHFMIAAEGYRKLVTQLFVEGGDYLGSDTVFGVKEPLIVSFPAQTGTPPDGRKVDEWRRLDFTFRLASLG